MDSMKLAQNSHTEKETLEIIELASSEIEKVAEALRFLADVGEFANFFPTVDASESEDSVH